jgi:hypothetical protein
VNECFFHCGKALIRSHLWQPDTWPDAARVSFGRQFRGTLWRRCRAGGGNRRKYRARLQR